MSRVGLVATFRFVPSPSPSPSRSPGEGEGGEQGGQEATNTETFERCWSTLESFLLFHLSKGVEHIFLYADDNHGSNDVYVGQLQHSLVAMLVAYLQQSLVYIQWFGGGG